MTVEHHMHLDDSAHALVGAGAAAGQQTPYLSITGTARIAEGWRTRAPQGIRRGDARSSEHFPPANAPAGLLTRIRIDEVGGIGPWVS